MCEIGQIDFQEFKERFKKWAQYFLMLGLFYPGFLVGIKIYYYYSQSDLIIWIFLLSRVLIIVFLQGSHRKIQDFIEKNTSKIPQEEKNKSEIRKEGDKSRIQAELVSKRDQELFWISILTGILEFVIFAFLAFFVFEKETDILNPNAWKSILLFIGGWLGIKILSSHRPWSDFVAGKAYYHISLIATLTNIIIGIITGYIIANQTT